MPVITLDSSKLTKEQKARMAKEMTKLASEVMNLPEQAFYIYFREYGLEEIGAGGELLSEHNKTASNK